MFSLSRKYISCCEIFQIVGFLSQHFAGRSWVKQVKRWIDNLNLKIFIFTSELWVRDEGLMQGSTFLSPSTILTPNSNFHGWKITPTWKSWSSFRKLNFRSLWWMKIWFWETFNGIFIIITKRGPWIFFNHILIKTIDKALEMFTTTTT